jgi:iron complex transport system substrate-binding protein
MKHPIIIFLLIVILILWHTLFHPPTSLPPSSPNVPNQPNPATQPFPRSLVDSSGHKLVLPTLPQRIVSQTLMTDEILLAICPPNRLAAVSALAHDRRYSNVVKAAQSFTPINENVEQILMLNPDLIFVASYSLAETVTLLQATGAPVFRLTHFQNIAAIKNNIITIGYAIGEKPRAIDLVEQMSQKIAAIRARIPQNITPPRVMSYSLGNYTAGSETSFNEIVNLVGAINVVAEAGIKQYIKISEEQILHWQPDFIITHAANDEFTLIKQQLLKNPAIAASQAGQLGKIIVIDSRYFLSISQYIVRGIETLAEELYFNDEQ